MKNSKEYKFNKSIQSKIFAVVIVIFIFLGIFLTVIAVQTVRNYYQPYKFSIIVGAVSIITGAVFTHVLRPLLKLNARQANNYYLAYLYMIIGFFGVFMFMGKKINSKLSSISVCENYSVVNKIFTERKGRYGGNELLLYVDIQNEIVEIETNMKYWKTVEVGSKINVCNFKSQIGFDYLMLTDEKY